MTLWSDPYTFADGQSVGSYQFNRYIRDNLRYLLWGAAPQRMTLWHDESLVTAGNALARTISASAYYTHYVRQNPSANGDTFTQSLVVLPGWYWMVMARVVTNNSGILDVYLEGEWIGQSDFYNASTVYQYDTGLVTFYSDGGRKTLTCVVNGKNGSSGGYDINLTQLFLKSLDGDL